MPRKKRADINPLSLIVEKKIAKSNTQIVKDYLVNQAQMEADFQAMKHRDKHKLLRYNMDKRTAKVNENDNDYLSLKFYYTFR